MQGFKGIRGNFFLEVAKFHICSELGLVLNKGHRAGKQILLIAQPSWADSCLGEIYQLDCYRGNGLWRTHAKLTGVNTLESSTTWSETGKFSCLFCKIIVTGQLSEVLALQQCSTASRRNKSSLCSSRATTSLGSWWDISHDWSTLKVGYRLHRKEVRRENCPIWERALETCWALPWHEW